MSSYYGWKPYVPVAKRRAEAKKALARLQDKGEEIQPVEISGRTIASTFWGKAWCAHMESQRDFANRLPRGRTYVRNGSVCHLVIQKGRVDAKVSGSMLYTVNIKIDLLPQAKWKQVQEKCSGQVGTLLELLQGRISDSVMEVVTDPKHGLFPSPAEIHLDCDCPDYATMCKHVAAVLYGVGARLDRKPELLFELRGVDHNDLVGQMSQAAVGRVTRSSGKRRQVAESDLADVFGIDLDNDTPAEPSPAKSLPKSSQTKPKKSGRKAKSPTSKSPSSATAKKSARRQSSRTKKQLSQESTAAPTAAKPKPPKKKTAKKTSRKTTRDKIVSLVK